MKTCPRCGAENRQAASECRMCATPFDLPASADARLGENVPQQFLTCPYCRAANDIDYIFCQHCGRKLPDRQVAEATPTIAPSDRMRQAGADYTICSACGQSVTATGFYCYNCGARLRLPASPQPKAVLQLIAEGGQVGRTYPIEKTETLIGRAEGDITFPHDGYMSSQHVKVIEREGRYYLSDQGSRNGTFVRISGEVELQPGDMFLVGKQLFRFQKR
jgi:predicted amidophosphoribosyltransferase